MLGQLLGALIIGLVVWLIGSLFDDSSGNKRARFVGFIVFAIAALVIVANHYGVM